MLQGRWQGDCSDGKSPNYWISSVSILQCWYQNNCQPVKYGQCWVFAGVMCTGTVHAVLFVPITVLAYNISRTEKLFGFIVALVWINICVCACLNVFMNPVMRFLGIPCRVVTNFESAHDTNNSLTIDKYYDDYGLRDSESKDSIW